MSSSGTSTGSSTGKFTVTLGAASTIQGISAYALTLTGQAGHYSPSWKYLASSDNQILGSSDGTTLQVVFDGKDGTWKGGGFFTSFDPALANTPSSTSVNNEYIATSAYGVGASSGAGHSMYVDGTDIPPSDTSYSITETEYYKAGMGPIAFWFSSTMTFGDGSTYKNTENSGLIATSLTATDGFVPKMPPWSEKAAMPHARNGFAAAGVNGKIYVTGGGDSSLDIYDPATDSWSSGTAGSFVFPITADKLSSGIGLGSYFYTFASPGRLP